MPAIPPGAPGLAFFRNAAAEAVAIAYAGKFYNTAVLAVKPSGDATGVTDTANIQAAIAIVAASSTTKGGVELAGGTFYVKATAFGGGVYAALNLVSNVDIIGRNKAKVILATSTEPNGYGGHVFFGSAVSKIRITGLEIDGNRTGFTSPPAATPVDGVAGNAVRLTGACSDIKIDNNWLHSHIYHGVLAVEGATRVHVDFNRINDNGYRAVHYNSTDASSVTDSSVNFNDVYGNGVAADNATNSGIFICLGACYRLEVIGNIINGEKAAGIQASGNGAGITSLGREVTILGNQVTGGTTGILLTTNLQDSNIQSNIVSSSTVAGMQLGPMVGCKVNGNTVRRTVGGPGMIVGATGADVISGTQLNNNHLIDNDGSVATNRAAMYIGSGAHTALSICGNVFLNNGVTAAGTAGGISNGGGSRIKGLSVCWNTFKSNKGSAIVLSNVDDAIVMGNSGMDNFEASGPRGSFVWIRGTSNNTLVSNNVCANANVANSLEQYLFDAATTNSICSNNYGQCGTNAFRAAAGSTGTHRGNTGLQRWTVTWGAGGSIPVTATAAYTVLNTDEFVQLDATTAPFTTTLPPVANCALGTMIVFVKIDAGANLPTIKGNASENINGANTYVLLATQYKSVTLKSTATGWLVVATA